MGLTNTYLSLPAWLQNVAVSAYGFKLHMDRYWHADPGFRSIINSNLTKTPEELENYRFEQLVERRYTLHFIGSILNVNISLWQIFVQ
jgi:hypothetical protein